MVKFRNQQNQVWCLVYSSKGHLVSLFYSQPNSRSITDTFFNTHEVCYNGKVLSLWAEQLFLNQEDVINQLKENPLNLKFTGAGNSVAYLIVDGQSIMFRVFDVQTNQEKYTFLTPFDVQTFIVISEYINSWKIAAILSDLSQNRRQQSYNRQPAPQQYQQSTSPNSYPQQFNGYQQPNPQPTNYPAPHLHNPPTNGFPNPDEIG